MQTLFKFHEGWIRSSAEAPNRQRHLYHDDDRDWRLAARMQELLTGESADWVGSEQAAGRVPGAPR
jgi:hypothetical protein